MNFTDYRVTGLHQVVRLIEKEAAAFDIKILNSELIGLLPTEAILETVKNELYLPKLPPDRLIEHHLVDLF